MVEIKEYFGNSNENKKILQYTDSFFVKIFRRIIFGKIKFVCNNCGKEAGSEKDLENNKCVCVKNNKVLCWDCHK